MTKLFKLTFFFFFTAVLFNQSFALSNPTGDGFFVSKEDFDNWVKEGSRQLYELKKRNADNNKKGCPEDNLYLFSFLPENNISDWWIEGRPQADIDKHYSMDLLTTLNDSLQQFNAQNDIDAEFYVCLATGWKIVVKEKPDIRLYNTQKKLVEYLKPIDYDGSENVTISNNLFNKLIAKILQNSAGPNRSKYYSNGVENKIIYAEAHFTFVKNSGDSTQLGNGYWNALSKPKNAPDLQNTSEWADYVALKRNDGTYTGNKNIKKLKSSILATIDYLNGNIDSNFNSPVPLLNWPEFDFYELYWAENLESVSGTEIESQFNDLVDDLALKVGQAVNANYGFNCTDSTSNYPYDEETFNFIINKEYTVLGEGEDKLLELEHKLAYLKEQTCKEFYVIFQPIDFIIPRANRNTLAQQIVNHPDSDLGGKDAVIITIPYANITDQDDIIDPVRKKLMPGIFATSGMLSDNFKTSVLPDIKDVYELIIETYKDLEKPYRHYIAYMPYGSDYFITDKKLSVSDERGFIAINQLILKYDNITIGKVASIDNQLSSLDFNLEIELYFSLLEEKIDVIKESENLPLHTYETLLYENQIKEKYLVDYYETYAAHEYAQRYWLTPAFHDAIFGVGFTEDILYAHSFHEYAYEVADLAGTVIAFTTGNGYVLFAADAVTVLLALTDQDINRGIIVGVSGALGISTGVAAVTSGTFKFNSKVIVRNGLHFVRKENIQTAKQLATFLKLDKVQDAALLDDLLLTPISSGNPKKIVEVLVSNWSIALKRL